MVRLLGCVFVLQVVVGGCAGLPGTHRATLDGRAVEFATVGQARPVVVFEHGLGSDMTTWRKVFREIASDTTVFAYDRPGAGGGDPAVTRRDGAHIVAELRALLRERGLGPPYVLVGHSLGGLYVQLFSRRHPDEIAGVVLVDSTHPAQFEGPNALDQSAIARALRWLLLSSTERQELAEATTTGQDVLRAPSLVSKPIAILSADSNPWLERGRFARSKQSDLDRLYPGSRHTWIDSGHFIQEDNPDSVIKEIRWVVGHCCHGSNAFRAR
jgi:pimeloyl-ACP methyl ester carboxylesterase